jgi:hypothetical protein
MVMVRKGYHERRQKEIPPAASSVDHADPDDDCLLFWFHFNAPKRRFGVKSSLPFPSDTWDEPVDSGLLTIADDFGFAM